MRAVLILAGVGVGVFLIALKKDGKSIKQVFNGTL
jgi:hypothetical protein